MKTYRIEFADGVFTTCLDVILLTMLCLTILGIPLAIAFAMSLSPRGRRRAGRQYQVVSAPPHPGDFELSR